MATETTIEKVEDVEAAEFPFFIFLVALLFDLVGWIPGLNVATEAVAGLLFGMWQVSYYPKVNPVISFLVAKLCDLGTLGALPSNMGLVFYTYIKKAAAHKMSESLHTEQGLATANKLLK